MRRSSSQRLWNIQDDGYSGLAVLQIVVLNDKQERIYQWTRQGLAPERRPFYADPRSAAGGAMPTRPTPSASAPIVRLPIFEELQSPSFFDLPISGVPSMRSARILEVRLDQPLPPGLNASDTAHLTRLQADYFRHRAEEERSRSAYSFSTLIDPFNWRDKYK